MIDEETKKKADKILAIINDLDFPALKLLQGMVDTAIAKKIIEADEELFKAK